MAQVSDKENKVHTIIFSEGIVQSWDNFVIVFPKLHAAIKLVYAFDAALW